MNAPNSESAETFDFARHEQVAVSEYLRVVGFYADLASATKRIADEAQLSRIAEGARQGQLSRFEYMLLAAMGERFIQRHQWHGESWFQDRRRKALERFKENNIRVGWYDPMLSESLVSESATGGDALP